MKKDDIRKKFRKITKDLEDTSTIEVKNENGVITEKGIIVEEGESLAQSDYITYGLDDDLIHFYSEGKEILKVDEESPIIGMIEFALGYTVEI